MECDVLVIGCGPAGLSAAGYAARAGYSVIAIDALAPGGQLLYIDEIENYPGVSSTSGFALAESFEKQAVSFGVSIEFMKAESIRKDGDAFIVTAGGDEIKSKAVIFASGARHRASHHSARMALVVSHGRGGREQPRRVTEHGTTGDGSPRPDRMHRCHHRPYGGGLLETPRKRTGNGHGRQPHGADRSVSSHPNARQPGHRGFLCFWVRGWI